MSHSDWVPTARLRFVERKDVARAEDAETGQAEIASVRYILQQWFAEDLPGYMRTSAAGEWRDVVVEEEAAP